MAELGSSGGVSLFVSPDNLVIDHHHPMHNNNNNNAYQDGGLYQHQYHHHHHQSHNVPYEGQQPQRPASFTDRHRPSLPNLDLPVHTLSDWRLPSQNSLRTQLPPTPLSPFRSLKALGEYDKMAFPCPGGPNGDDCWNSELCPKHRQSNGTPPKPDNEANQMNGHTAPPPNNSNYARRQSPSTSSCEADSDSHNSGTCKRKRNTTESEQPNPERSRSASQRRPSHHQSLSFDSRGSHSRGRVPHNLVERRYRDNLNHQIEALRLTLPTLREAQPCSSADFEDTSSPRMPSKAIIISTAATYIKDMENERARLLDANKALVEQVESLQKMVRSDGSNILQYVNAMRLTAGQLPTPM